MEVATQCISKRNFVCCLPLIAIHFTTLFSSHSHKNKNFLVYSMYFNVMLTTYKLKLTSKVQCAVNLCCNKFDPKKSIFLIFYFAKFLHHHEPTTCLIFDISEHQKQPNQLFMPTLLPLFVIACLIPSLRCPSPLLLNAAV